MEHILVDQSTANYIPITENEFSLAPINSRGEKIITPESNIFHDFRDSCEMTIRLNPRATNLKELCNFRTIPITNYFIVMDSFNKYFLSISKPTTLIELCHDKPITPKHINSSGFLTLSENCRTQTDKITLRPRIKTTVNNHSDFELLSNLSAITFEVLEAEWNNVTHIEHLISPEPSLLIDDHLKDFDELADQTDNLINQMSDQNTLDELYQGRVKHNFFLVVGIVSFFFIIILIGGICLYKRFYNIQTWVKLANLISPPTVDSTNNIPMTSITAANRV